MLSLISLSIILQVRLIWLNGYITSNLTSNLTSSGCEWTWLYELIQVLIGVVILIKGRYNINKEENHSKAECLNNLTVWMIFAVTVINVFMAAFGIDNLGPIANRSLPLRDGSPFNTTMIDH